MIIFLFGLSGSGKNHYSNLLAQRVDFEIINISDLIKDFGTEQIRLNPYLLYSKIETKILDEIDEDKHIIVEGIRQPQIYEYIKSQLCEKSYSLFLDNENVISNLKKRNMTYSEIYDKIELDIQLKVLFLRKLADQTFEIKEQTNKQDGIFLDLIDKIVSGDVENG